MLPLDFQFGNNARDGVDSDQSISEEDEDLEGEYRENTISLGATADKSQGMKVLSQLQILRDSCKHFAQEKERYTSHERKAGCFSDDEVENPLFDDDDEDGFISLPRSGTASHSIQGIMHLTTMASNSHYDEEIISDGEESCSPILRSGAVAYSKTKNFMADSQLIMLEKESGKTDSHAILCEVARKDNIKQNSVADSLDCFYENFARRTGNPEMDTMKSGREVPMVPERNALSLVDEILADDDDDDDDDELPEPFNGRLSNSSGDEENLQHPNLAIPMRTMADQFCEAFGTVSGHRVRSHLTLSGPSCSSIHGKLQRLIQAEKEQDIDYMKNRSAGTSSIDEINSIKVRILSRHFEAKLVICSCTGIEDAKENDFETKAKDVARSFTVIFNPRICSDIELEVDNVICIHLPWKEVKVNGRDEVVLLSSYYSQNCP